MKQIQENIAYRLSGLISAKLGLNFPKERFGELEQGLLKAKKDFGFEKFDAFIDRLLETELNNEQIELLATHFTIGETYFFRDIKYFNAIVQLIKEEIIPKNSAKDKRLRIWSAGCSTGEESYSIAILLDKFIPEIRDWKITIMATDINTKSLKKAREGNYKDWSFRNSPDWLKPDYFTEITKSSYRIIPAIKEMVTFQYHNLAIDPFPSPVHNIFAFDIIFCRNVMMYFTQDLMTKTIEKFFHSLNDTGFFVVSPSEASHLLFSAFETLYEPDVILYRKKGSEYNPSQLPVIHKVDKKPEKEIIEDYDFTRLSQKAKKLNNIPKFRNKGTSKKEKIIKEIDDNKPLSPIDNANMLFDKGRYEESEKLLKSILSSDNKNINAMTLLSKIYGNRGIAGEAMNWCQKAIEIDKLNPEPYFLKATILQESGNTDEAINWLKKALYLDSQFIIAHFGLGNLLMKQGKLSESNKYFKNVCNLLARHNDDEIIPESAGITAGRLKEIISKLTENNFKDN